MPVKVSVVVPVYNMELHLEKCLDSILAQTLRDIEVVIVDDGSEDKSPVILERYASQDPRIRVLSQPNAGLAAARNLGIRAAVGEFIGFVDSDDYVDSCMFENLYQRAISDRSDVVICQYREVSSTGKVRRTSSIQEQPTKEAYFRKVLSAEESSMACNKMYRLSLFADRNIAFPVGLLHEDVPTIYRLIYYAESVSVVPDIGYNWVRRAGSISKSVSFKHVLDLMWGLALTLQFLRAEGVDIKYRDCFTRRSFHFSLGGLDRMRRDHPDQESTVRGLIELWLNVLGVNSAESLLELKQIDEHLYKRCQLEFDADLTDSLSARQLQAQLAKAEDALTSIKESLSYRLGHRIVTIGGKVLPPGSKRRHWFLRVVFFLRRK